MWIVKLGGSLNTDPLLPDWLKLLAQLGGGRVAIVCGGGEFADEVRRAQAHWSFPDLSAHNMALLAMAQSAYLAYGLEPELQLVPSLAEVRRALHGGRTALWLPLELLTQQPAADTHWDHTSDSIALGLARQLNAERLVIVKACEIPPGATLADLSGAEVLDRRFARAALSAPFPIDVFQRTELRKMRSLLLGPRSVVG